MDLVTIIIVKNESENIIKTLKCLEHMSNFFILDTGSTDDTFEIVSNYFENSINIISKSDFVDFSTTRNLAITLAKSFFENCELFLMIDCEWYAKDFYLNNLDLTYDVFNIVIKDDKKETLLPRLFKRNAIFFFEGEVHEYVISENICPKPISGFFEISKSSSYSRWITDISILQNNLSQRNIYYLGQTYMNLNDYDKALEYFMYRLEYEDDSDETYRCLMNIAHIYIFKKQAKKALEFFMRSYFLFQNRAEPLFYACLNIENKKQKYLISSLCITIEEPEYDDHLERNIYKQRFLLHATLCYELKKYDEALDIIHKCLSKFNSEKLQMLKRLIEDKFLIRKIRSENLNSEIITIAIFAKNKEHVLFEYLNCIYNQTWSKNRTNLYIKTNNNTDNTYIILRNWLNENQHEYNEIYFNCEDFDEKIEKYSQHEWNLERFKIMGKIREDSLLWSYEHKSHYFTVDCDNFILPETITQMFESGLKLVSPLIRSKNFCNFHVDINEDGIPVDNEKTWFILNQEIKGFIEVPVIHCCYFIRNEILLKMKYRDESSKHEYLIFSENCRKEGISQFIDNRKIYGFLTFSNTKEEFQEEIKDGRSDS